MSANIKKFRIKSLKRYINIKTSKYINKIWRKTILDNLNLNLNDGQILGLLGANGG